MPYHISLWIIACAIYTEHKNRRKFHPVRDRIFGGTTLINASAFFFSYRYRRCYAVLITQDSEAGSGYFP